MNEVGNLLDNLQREHQQRRGRHDWEHTARREERDVEMLFGKCGEEEEEEEE